MIVTLGDTASHLKSGQELKKLFQEIFKSLNPGGFFVLQTRNYDFILKHQARFTPPTGSRNGTEETLFFRLLDFNHKSLKLNVAKFRWHENRWESSIYTTEIYPYTKKELESALKSVGFSKSEAYRNYNFEDYDPNGSDLILIAQKKGALKSRSSGRREKVSFRAEPNSRALPRRELTTRATTPHSVKKRRAQKDAPKRSAKPKKSPKPKK